MKDTYLMPDQINHGFQLAYLVLCDKELALNITQDAMTALKFELRQQKKRSHYKPQGAPYKIVWDKASLFKLLVLQMSERYEKNQETSCVTSGQNLSEEDLIVRYVKCLLFETMSRNAFYTAVGICKLLYNYSLRETEAIYTWLIPDFKDDAAFRRAKVRIKSRLSLRFKDFIEEDAIHTTSEQRPSTVADSNWKSQLVEKILDLLKPTAMLCPPPEFFKEYTIWEKQPAQGKAVGPDQLEQTRIHIMVCPSCFKTLNTSLGHQPPYERLALPEFYFTYGKRRQDEGDSDDINLPDLTLADFYKVLTDKI